MPSSSKPPPSRPKRRRRKFKHAKFTPKVSKLEKRVGKILRAMGLKPRTQHPMYSTTGRLRGVFDFFFPKQRLALEVNGTFWHSDPRVWPTGPKYRTQKHAARSWKKKLNYAATQGIEVRVVWELDLLEDPVAAIEKALA